MIGEEYSNAMAGRTARACDSCVRRRARWFCAADDAFLCQSCDLSVHGANQLAGRHHRVRLRSSSFKTAASTAEEQLEDGKKDEFPLPAWHRGFTRKTRTPRRHNIKSQKQANSNKGYAEDEDFMEFDSFFGDEHPLPLVPEMSGEEEQEGEEREEEEMSMIHQVPVFDSFDKERIDYEEFDDHQILGFLDSELDLADVESLLGVEDNKSCLILEEEEEDEEEKEPVVKVEVVEDYNQSTIPLGFQQNPNHNLEKNLIAPNYTDEQRSNVLLALNYEAVIAAWDEQGSPWMTGIRPNVKTEHGWPECVDVSSADFRQTMSGDWKLGHNEMSRKASDGREARVSRYREKRRTRLFSKKIRYEVRKLNAEKRPRMKGRFVKRTSFLGPNSNNNNNNYNPNNNATINTTTTTFPYHFIHP